jgi:2-polyprenyl-3-methyl-5-hydroxy-6-metoxy-1,4-benzoquinol methylase
VAFWEFDFMLEWTGERFLPWIGEATIAYEHLHRYAYAATLVRNKRVLDLACGEGYGTKMLATAATSAIGVDIDESVIRHASGKYGSANLRFLQGSITAIPLKDDHSIDVIVCFEAIEHIEDQEALLREVERLLAPDGIFIVSTPNKAIYRDQSTEENPFHLKELYFEELQEILARHFRNTRFLGQQIHPSSSIWPIDATSFKGFHEFVLERSHSEFQFIEATKRVPLYFIAIASNGNAVIAPPGSVLLDESDSLFAEKKREREECEKQVRARDQTIASLEEALQWREGQIKEHEKHINSLAEGLEWSRGRASELEMTIASQREALSWRAVQVSELETAKLYWERESAARADELQKAERRLREVTDILRSVEASLTWKVRTRLRKIGNRFLSKSGAADGPTGS